MAFQPEWRRIWECANGPIPQGCVIHHVDGDHENNNLSNLRMMRPGEHSRLHHETGLRACYTPHESYLRRDKARYGYGPERPSVTYDPD